MPASVLNGQSSAETRQPERKRASVRSASSRVQTPCAASAVRCALRRARRPCDYERRSRGEGIASRTSRRSGGTEREQTGGRAFVRAGGRNALRRVDLLEVVGDAGRDSVHSISSSTDQPRFTALRNYAQAPKTGKHDRKHMRTRARAHAHMDKGAPQRRVDTLQ